MTMDDKFLKLFPTQKPKKESKLDSFKNKFKGKGE